MTAVLPPRAKDLTGRRFGMLVAIEYAGVRHSSGGRSYTVWKAHCDCGADRIVRAALLVNGKSKSCGCRVGEAAAKQMTQHGGSGTPLHRVWTNMLTRCTNPNRHNYSDYGGRGIRVCDRWLHFAAFRDDMGAGYSKGLMLDRIDNDGPYSPENCRWATAEVQQRNKRTNRIIATPAGKMVLRAAADYSGIASCTLRYRVLRGWPTERLFDPARPSRPREHRTNQENRNDR